MFDCDCKSSREFNGLFLLRVLGCPKLAFHWSAAWLSWPPLWWGVISFQNLRTLKLGLYFCVDFLASRELIGHLDLTDSYEIWPKCSLIINAQKCVRLFWFSKYFFFYALSCDEDQQILKSCYTSGCQLQRFRHYFTDGLNQSLISSVAQTSLLPEF